MHFRKGQADSRLPINPLPPLCQSCRGTPAEAPPTRLERDVCRGRVCVCDLRDRLICRKGHSEASWTKKKKEKIQGVGTIDLEAFFYLSGRTCGSWCSSRPMVRGRDSNLLVLQISSSIPPPCLPLCLLCSPLCSLTEPLIATPHHHHRPIQPPRIQDGGPFISTESLTQRV